MDKDTSATRETRELSLEIPDFLAEVMSPSGTLWRRWFDRMGEGATVNVINATAELVIGERDLALKAALATTESSTPSEKE